MKLKIFLQAKVASPNDVLRLCESVSSVVACVRVNHTGWTHADFEIGNYGLWNNTTTKNMLLVVTKSY